MRSSGNGRPAVCADNLTRISRGEVPYDRIRGVKFAELVGDGIAEQEDLAEDTAWMVSTYEPRVTVEGVDVAAENAVNGRINVTVRLKGGNA